MNTQKCEGLLGEMGYIQELCPRCNAHLYESNCLGTTQYICLNGCHLSETTLRNFTKMMGEITEKLQTTKEADRQT